MPRLRAFRKSAKARRRDSSTDATFAPAVAFRFRFSGATPSVPSPALPLSSSASGLRIPPRRSSAVPLPHGCRTAFAPAFLSFRLPLSRLLLPPLRPVPPPQPAGSRRILFAFFPPGFTVSPFLPRFSPSPSLRSSPHAPPPPLSAALFFRPGLPCLRGCPSPRRTPPLLRLVRLHASKAPGSAVVIFAPAVSFRFRFSPAHPPLPRPSFFRRPSSSFFMFLS